jgi:hypothetical protein
MGMARRIKHALYLGAPRALAEVSCKISPGLQTNGIDAYQNRSTLDRRQCNTALQCRFRSLHCAAPIGDGRIAVPRVSLRKTP